MSQGKPELSFTVPLVPVSVNHYKKPRRGGRGYYVTKEALAFKEAVQLVVRRRRVDAEKYELDAVIYLGKGQKGDLDNFGKLICDSIKDAGVVSSDAKFCEIHLRKERDCESPRTEITVRAL